MKSRTFAAALAATAAALAPLVLVQVTSAEHNLSQSPDVAVMATHDAFRSTGGQPTAGLVNEILQNEGIEGQGYPDAAAVVVRRGAESLPAVATKTVSNPGQMGFVGGAPQPGQAW